MKRLVLIALCLLTFTVTEAQTPFQFNFQAVARDLAGNPMVNENVEFRLSILQGSEVGTAIFVEDQNVQTNNFGLANLLVGTGTPVTGTLNAIDWATGPFFLQIELDINNGQGMQLMGVSAMTSVPYALHALTTEQPGPEGPQGEQGEQGPQGEQGLPGIDGLDAVVDSVYLDSLVQSFVANTGIGGGCNLRFPEGIHGDPITHSFSTSYTVPSGKNLYVLNLLTNPTYTRIDGVGVRATYTNTALEYDYENVLIVGEQQTISTDDSDGSFIGLLMDKNIDGFTHNFNQSYTVPAGKKLHVLNLFTNATYTRIDGVPVRATYTNTASNSDFNNVLILGAGSVISTDDSDGSFNGYVVDEDYFAGCGAGGLSNNSGSAIDSTAVAEMIANSSIGGCDINFPEGISGEGITLKLFTPYTVPENTRLYITQMFSWESTLEIDGNLICYGGNLPSSTGRSFTLGNTIVVNSGQIVSASSSNTRISGLLVPSTDALEGVTLSVGVDPAAQYVVPEGKKLYVTSVQSYNSILKIDDIQIVSMSNYSHNASDPYSLNNPIVANAGQVLAALDFQVEDTVVVNGYLVDEDYFAGCGGGGSSAGDAGSAGQSAYDIWIELGNVGTEEEFIASLIGPQGAQGEQGLGISLVEVVGDSLVTTLDDGTTFSSEIVSPPGGSGASNGIKLGFSESTSWTCPDGVTQITVELWGGAGGGGSSSGWAYRWSSGTYCYQSFWNNPGGGGYTGGGASGGSGGKGGYNKQVISVTPGETYDIVIGAGGAGGIGGCPIGVNSGSDGSPGEASTFELSAVVLAQGDGGAGGGKGYVPCGCGNVGGGGNGNPDCAGWYNGAVGADGAVINYVSAVSAPTLPSYVPADYLTPVVDCCSTGGSPGWDGSGCLISNNQDNNYPELEVGAAAGGDGEAGFVVISF